MSLSFGDGRPGQTDLTHDAKMQNNDGKRNFYFTLALTFYPLPQERKRLLADSGFAGDCPTNSVARIFKETANNSPSPWGESKHGARSDAPYLPCSLSQVFAD
jgi:hypothetical protein